MLDSSPYGPANLPPWFDKPHPTRDRQPCLFASRLPDALSALRVSVDELARWRSRGWVSFGVDHAGPIEEWHLNELRFVRDVMRSGLTDAQVDHLLGQLPQPTNFNCDAVAYSFSLGWVMVRPRPDYDEVVNEHVDEWLGGLAEEADVPRLTELRDRINRLLVQLVGSQGRDSR